MKDRKTLAIYNPYLDTKGGGEKVSLAMAEVLTENYNVTLISREPTNVKELGNYFGLDLSKCKHVTLQPTKNLIPRIAQKLHIPPRLTNLLYEYQDYRRIKKMGYDIFVNNCYKSTIPNPSQYGVYMCMFPQEYLNLDGMSIVRRIYHKFVDFIEVLLFGQTGLDIIQTYDVITVNSKYTAKWTKKMWGINDSDIDVLYPICENMSARKDANKEKIILNVGRFFADSGENHYKCQDKLLEVFSEMKDLHDNGWQLHFVGSLANDKDSVKYLQGMVSAAKGLPIFFHANTPFNELKRQFQKASIYWHATGWGSDTEKHPEKQEHFGISTVEAMSAGAVPVVIDSAGQIETVDHGKNGYRWSTKEDLQNYTRKLIADPSLRKDFSRSAVRTAAHYNKEQFHDRIFDIFSKFDK